MMCIMQNHMIQAFANSGNAIKPVSFIRDLKSKNTSPPFHSGQRGASLHLVLLGEVMSALGRLSLLEPKACISRCLLAGTH